MSQRMRGWCAGLQRPMSIPADSSQGLRPFTCTSVSPCRNLASTPLSGEGVRNQAESSPPTPTGEVQPGGRQPKAQPPPRVLTDWGNPQEPPRSSKVTQSLQRKLLPSGCAPGMEYKIYLVDFREEVTHISWAPALCPTAFGEQKGTRPTPKKL